jgi:hypothetical protein
MIARESAARMTSYPISALDGRMAANVTATAKPEIRSEVDDEGKVYTEIRASIGTQEPVTCWVYSKRLDAGGFVKGILDHAKGQVGVPEIDVTAHDDGPIVLVDVPIRVDGAPERSEGSVAPPTTRGGGTRPTGGELFAMPKMAIAPRDDGTVACLHDEVGYRKTFRIFVKGLLSSASLRSDEAPSKFFDVAVWREAGKVAGFAERRVKVKNGERLETTYGAALLEHDGSWSFLDAATGTATTLDGKLLRSDSALVLGGTMVSHMHVEKIGEGEFSYSGVNKGKKLEGTFKSRGPLTTELALAPKLRSIAAGKSAEVRYVTFDEDKGAASEVVFKKDKTGITRSFGAEKHKVEIDEAGTVRAETDAGRTFERLLSRGSP